MMRNTKAAAGSVLQHHTPDLDALKSFVTALNTTAWKPVSKPNKGASLDSNQLEVHRLVKAWFDSGPNVSKLFEANPQLMREALSIEAHIIATRAPQAKLVFIPQPRNMSPDDENFIAHGQFLGFLLNPFNERLGGPCAYCGRFFVKKTNRTGTIYCSVRCGTSFTSRAANEKRRKLEYKNRLDAVKRTLAAWQLKNRKGDWKEWVSREARVSKNWITRAAAAGMISAPVKKPQ